MKKIWFTYTATYLLTGTFCFAETSVSSIRCDDAVLESESSVKARWVDPEVFSVNRLPAHAFSLVFPDEKSATPEPDWADPYAGSSRFQSLNGKWDFKWSPNMKEAPRGFQESGFDVSSWDKIPVPSPWQVCGYGQLYYFNTFPPFFGDPRNNQGLTRKGWCPETKALAEDGWVPTEFNPIGSYRNDFTIPKSWDGMRVILHFGGVQSAFTCWVNGKEVGYSQDSYTPAEFDITEYLQLGTNHLAVQVIRWSDGTYMENQDQIRMSGIVRDVMLIARPPRYIEDFYLVSTLDPAMTQGTLHAQVSLLNSAVKTSSAGELEITLLDANSKPVLQASASATPLPSGQNLQITFPDLALDNPVLWHPESPHLYTVLLTLKEDGLVREVIRQDVGFRRFEWNQEGNIYLNGARFYMRGVNRVDNSPNTGRTVDYAEMLKDVRLMKQHNVNTVRNAHYPRDPRWQALCARYGLAVIDEANLETHNNEVIMSDAHPEWRAQALFRVRNMVMRNRNEPAIVMWSLGNEQFIGWSQTVEEMAKLTKGLDSTRGIMAQRASVWDLEKGIINGKGLIDFVSPMYNEMDRIRRYKEHWENGERLPFFFCEYAHSMGNSMANLDEYWSKFESHDGFNGGCIWDWADQALLMPIKGYPGKTWTYGGDWGEYSSDKIFCANGIFLPDRSIATAKPREVKSVYQQVSFGTGKSQQSVSVANKYVVRNLKEFDLKWSLLRNGDTIQSGIMNPDVPPLSTREITIPFTLPAVEAGDRFDLNFDLTLRQSEVWADSGYEVAYGQIPLKVDAYASPEFHPPKGLLTLENSPEAITVSGNDFDVIFDRKAGTLSQYRLHGKNLLDPDVLLAGVELNSSSAATDDRKQTPSPQQRTAYAKGYDRLQRSNAKLRITFTQPERIVIETSADYLASDGKGLHHQAFYTVFADGTIGVDNRVQKIDLPDNAFLIRLGVRVPLSRTLEHTEYAGLGPLANYSDRKAGARYGHYRLNSSDFYENYIRPQECGNREEVDWIALKDDREGLGLVFTGNDRFSASVMPWTDEQIGQAEHRNELPASTRNILRIDARMSGISRDDNVNFAGDTAFSYSIRPLRPQNNAAGIALPSMPANLMQQLVLTGQPLVPGIPENWKWISREARVSYSSTSQWAVHPDTLLTTYASAFSFHTREEEKPWLIIDLQAPHPIAGFEILNREDRPKNRLSNPCVWLSGDQLSWHEVFRAPNSESRWLVKLDKPILARYVKIGLDNGKPEFFHLKGVKIFEADTSVHLEPEEISESKSED